METIIEPYSPDRHHVRSPIRSSCCKPVIVRLGEPGFSPIPRWRFPSFLEHHIITGHEGLPVFGTSPDRRFNLLPNYCDHACAENLRWELSLLRVMLLQSM